MAAASSGVSEASRARSWSAIARAFSSIASFGPRARRSCSTPQMTKSGGSLIASRSKGASALLSSVQARSELLRSSSSAAT